MVHYSADSASAPPRERGAELLGALGEAVRARRAALGITLRELATRAGVSVRFLAQLEAGEGNVSIVRLQEIAQALGASLAELVVECEKSGAGARARKKSEVSRVIALLGLRGAGKSSLGARAAAALGVPFVELDALVAREAGMSLATIFEMHGEAYYRRVEHEALRKFLERSRGAVLATGGSIVTAPETYELLRRGATTVWLKAKPRDHWDRVVAQGDVRPMQDRPAAMTELKELLDKRGPLYEQADYVINTSAMPMDQAVSRLVEIGHHPGNAKRK
jgi:XRE family aerobic/anaerobic benzoate catabolism transcriptional regulator